MAQVSKINMGGIDYDIRDKVLEQEVTNIKPIVNQGTINNAADEEDLTSENSLLKLKDRSALNGMGYVILRKNKTFAEQVTKANTIYEIRYDFDLQGKEITIPSNCVLFFDGGKLTNGTIVGNHTYISSNLMGFFSQLNLIGVWENTIAHIEWWDDNNSNRAFYNLNCLVNIFPNVKVETDITLENSLTLSFVNIDFGKSNVTINENMAIDSSVVVSGGKFIMNCPYYAVKVIGNHNTIIDAHFERSESYSVTHVDNFIAVFHTAYDTKIEGCIFGKSALYDILVSGTKTEIERCSFLSHENDLDDIKCCAVKTHIDKEQQDSDESATGANFFIINNCDFEYHTDNAIDTFTGGQNGIISNSIFHHCKEGVIEVKTAYRKVNDEGTSYPTGRYTENLKFVNNMFYGYVTIQTPLLDDVYAEVPKYVEYITFEDNVFTTTGTSVFLNGCENIKFVRNVFKVSASNGDESIRNIFNIQRYNNHTIIDNCSFLTSEQIVSCRPDANVSNLVFCNNNVKLLDDFSRASLLNLMGENIVVKDNAFTSDVYKETTYVLYPYYDKIKSVNFTNNNIRGFKYVVNPHASGVCMIDFLEINHNVINGDNFTSFLFNTQGTLNVVVMKNNIINVVGGRYYYIPSKGVGDFTDKNNLLLNSGGGYDINIPQFGTSVPNKALKHNNIGDLFFMTNNQRPAFFNGTSWLDADGGDVGLTKKGSNSDARPKTTEKNVPIGYLFFENNKPIWHLGGDKWVDSTGTIV